MCPKRASLSVCNSSNPASSESVFAAPSEFLSEEDFGSFVFLFSLDVLAISQKSTLKINVRRMRREEEG